MSNIISVSISSEQQMFLDETKTSPSRLLQSKIDELIESHKVSRTLVMEKERKIAFLQQTIDKQRNFIEAKGLMPEFFENV